MCITIAANIAETAILMFPACFPDSVVGFIADESKCDVRFIEYMFRNLRSSIQHEATGSVQDNINLEILGNLRFPVPPIQEQRDIAEILSALDNKIGLSSRMNETLDAISRTVFTDMFPELLCDPAHPDAVPIADILSISRDTLDPGDLPTELFAHYSIPAFDESRLPNEEIGRTIRSHKFLVYADSVLLSKLNPRIPRVWLPSIDPRRKSICSTEFLVLRPKRYLSREFVYGLCSSKEFQEAFSAMVTGTSGSHQRVKQDYFENLAIRRPDAEIVNKFTNVVRPLHSRVAHNLAENITLSNLRDTLLPKLVTGDLRVPNKAEAKGGGKS
jgi:type I restriction enzyme S subunit